MSAMSSSQQPKQESPRALPLGRVEAYFLSRVSYRLDPAWKGEPDNPITVDLGARVQRGNEAGLFQVTVNVTIKSAEKDKPAPYEADLEAVVLLGGMPTEDLDDELKKHIARVAAPMAYGAIREELLNLSARGPYPRLLLPLVPAKALVDSALKQEAPGT